MNILHVKYALEIANTGSLNKAAEKLLIAQPNLSRAVKELESDLGISIFERTSKGMILTPEGEDFIDQARKVVGQIEDLEMLYQKGVAIKQKFSISVPRAYYVCEAFTNLTMQLQDKPCEIIYKETNSSRTLKNVLSMEYKLGIIRYAEKYDKYYKTMLEEKGLSYELVNEFGYVIMVSKDSPLAKLQYVKFSDLKDYTQIAHPDPFVPSLPMSVVKREELPSDVDKRIYVFERASQFNILAKNLNTYMWVSPVAPDLLERYGLVQLENTENQRKYKDLLIRRKDYRLSDIDKLYMKCLAAAKEHCFIKK